MILLCDIIQEDHSRCLEIVLGKSKPEFVLL